jgi:hypothetical protein
MKVGGPWLEKDLEVSQPRERQKIVILARFHVRFAFKPDRDLILHPTPIATVLLHLSNKTRTKICAQHFFSDRISYTTFLNLMVLFMYT